LLAATKALYRPSETAPMSAGSPCMKLFKRFWTDESGATSIEYGLIAAGIAVVIITAVKTVGTKLKATFTSISGALG
jgi:pilus assembly protein Flp/PilA